MRVAGEQGRFKHFQLSRTRNEKELRRDAKSYRVGNFKRKKKVITKSQKRKKARVKKKGSLPKCKCKEKGSLEKS